jgi:hypothetical protein
MTNSGASSFTFTGEIEYVPEGWENSAEIHLRTGPKFLDYDDLARSIAEAFGMEAGRRITVSITAVRA